MQKRKENGSTPAQQLLREYSDLLRENDNQIRRLEKLTTLPEPTSSQQARIVELEDEIKTSITIEREKGAAVEALVNELSKAEYRAILRMRYFDLLEWWDVVFALYGDDADYTKNKPQHQRRVFRHHSEAVKELDLLLARRAEA
jgi:hypothetical protein